MRTPEQTDIAYFYADNTFLLWNRTLRCVATTSFTHLGDSARLFALASLATADAVITAWDSRSLRLLATRDGDPGGATMAMRGQLAIPRGSR